VADLLAYFSRLFLYLTLDRFGRRKMTVFVFSVLGLSCIGLAFVPKTEAAAVLALFLLGRFAGSAGLQVRKSNLTCYVTIFVYPTVKKIL
jgi:nitrate/nitrite transporter NarK